jgi:adenylate cyclase
MGIEIERKFLTRGPQWRDEVVQTHTIRQGYLSTDVDRVVRVRVVNDETGFITVKGRRHGATRAEFEYQIPGAEAVAMLDRLCLRPFIEKRRHILSLRPGAWVVDEFLGVCDGLVLAEVELPDEDSVPPVPAWAGRDVTSDDRYTNAALVASGGYFGEVPGGS